MTLHKSVQWNGVVIRGKSLLTANSYDRTGRTFPRGPATAAVTIPAVMAAIAVVAAGTAGTGSIAYRLPVGKVAYRLQVGYPRPSFIVRLTPAV